MQYVILDLEWNSGYSSKTEGFINEIIEFGAVKLDENMQLIGQFSIFVRPEITRRLKTKVKELTQITNEDLKHGSTFTYAVSKFRKFAEDCVIMSWSTSDLKALEENCRYYYQSERIPFLRYYADVQAYCQQAIDSADKNQMALQTAAEKLSVDMSDIPLHRAVGDSILTARVLKKVYDRRCFEPYIQLVDDEFYKKLNFHNTFIYHLENPLIDREKMYFLCPKCGAVCTCTEEWTVKGKAFRTIAVCESCNVRYKGKIQFKLCYEGVKILKRLVPLQSEETLSEDAQEQINRNEPEES